MNLKLYNSLTKKIEEFIPQKPSVVTMYNCGPTVYKSVHIGNYRSYVFADVLRRVLEFKGFNVKQVINLTDVGHMTIDNGSGEDKVEKAAKEEKLSPLELSNKYATQFFEDRKNLRLKDPLVYPRATDHISEVIEMVQVLLKKKHAYEVKGTIYFDISSMPEYGKLSGNSMDKLHAGSRVDISLDKKNPLDFALWISDPTHVLQWESPWGRGYPGWHMECSVMSAKYLTDAYYDGHFHPELFRTIDIHTGGEDNLFPHHECEIAQSECSTGVEFVKYWLHVKHLILEGKKMSKSEGNFFTIQDLLEQGVSPSAIRYTLMAGNYRQKMNFTRDSLFGAEQNIKRINEMYSALERIAASENLGSVSQGSDINLDSYLTSFEEAINNNLNISGALGVMNELRSYFNQMKFNLTPIDASNMLTALKKMDMITDILDQKEDINKEIMLLVDQRTKVRSEKKYSDADRLRYEIRKRGYDVRDTPKGPEVIKL
jgi:cysteinyl-tRNA synthetase